MEKEYFLKLLNKQKRSKRSKQKRIGPSEIGGCSRRLWHRLQDTPITNEDTLVMAAFMGTAIHTALENEIKREDPFGERFLLEQRLEWEEFKGQVDCFDKEAKQVIDWKTTSKKNLSQFPNEKHIAQVNMYGFLLEKHGLPVELVTLVGIPRDGHETDVVWHTEPYNRDAALESSAHARDIASRLEPPEPEMYKRFCQMFCPYYDASEMVGCPGRTGRS